MTVISMRSGLQGIKASCGLPLWEAVGVPGALIPMPCSGHEQCLDVIGKFGETERRPPEEYCDTLCLAIPSGVRERRSALIISLFWVNLFSI